MKKQTMLGLFLVSLAAYLTPIASAGTYGAGYNHDYGLQLFTGRNFSGGVISVRADIPRLDHLGFNDRAHSIVVNGLWEACEHANFVGRCVLVSEDVYDLNTFGLGGELTAVRPIYDTANVPHGFVFIRQSNGRIYEVSQYYAQRGYAPTYYKRYDHYSWHPVHVSLFARFGHYHPSFGYGRYGFAHPNYRKYGFQRYAPHYRRHVHRNVHRPHKRFNRYRRDHFENRRLNLQPFDHHRDFDRNRDRADRNHRRRTAERRDMRDNDGRGRPRPERERFVMGQEEGSRPAVRPQPARTPRARNQIRDIKNPNISRAARLNRPVRLDDLTRERDGGHFAGHDRGARPDRPESVPRRQVHNRRGDERGRSRRFKQLEP